MHLRSCSKSPMAHPRPAHQPDPRDPPGKRRIREAARAAIIEHGFDRAASRNITTAAGVSTALLFYYYGSLEECLIDAVESSEQGVGDRLHAALAGEADPNRRASLLVEWNLPVSELQRSEWMLASEFERASLRVAGISDIVAAQYRRRREVTADEYRAIDPSMPAEVPAVRADRLLGLADGLSWQLMLGNAPEQDVREILCDTVAADLGLHADAVLAAGRSLGVRIATIRGLRPPPPGLDRPAAIGEIRS
jgi:AcrR family transcriptional regulator